MAYYIKVVHSENTFLYGDSISFLISGKGVTNFPRGHQAIQKTQMTRFTNEVPGFRGSVVGI